MLLIESDPSVKSCLLVEERCILIPKPKGPQNIRKQPETAAKNTCGFFWSDTIQVLFFNKENVVEQKTMWNFDAI